MTTFNERHFIIVPIELEEQANAEAVKWDRDAGGSRTFSGAGASSDGGQTMTHRISSTLIDSAYVPPGQGGLSAMQVLDAFYATGFYQGYRIRRPQEQIDGTAPITALNDGIVEKYLMHPSRWEVIGEGRLADIALADAGLVMYYEMEQMAEPEQPEYPEWVQPLGGHDAYQIGDRVTYQGKVYESTVANNVWSPVTFGWKEVV